MSKLTYSEILYIYTTVCPYLLNIQYFESAIQLKKIAKSLIYSGLYIVIIYQIIAIEMAVVSS